MFHRPARENEWVSWLFVILWTGIIFLTIPLARTLQEFIRDLWGREAFTTIVLIAITVASLGTIGHLLRSKTASLINYSWLLLVAMVFAVYSYQLSRAPEEALHFIEYAFLGILIYRAFTHRIRDYSIYFSVALVGAIIGTIDETIQWLTPERYWDYGDIWLNFVAVSLTQIAIAGGLAPTLISARPNTASLRLSFRLCIVSILLLTLTLLNTPARVTWYADRVPALEFLKHNPSTMSEYGHRHHIPDIGNFRSRLSSDELHDQDETRPEQAAEILDQYHNRRKYAEFLQVYTPDSDPFVHEARVHLFRRDRHLSRSNKSAQDESLSRYYLDVAYREHQIIERYFPNTLRHSRFVLDQQTLQRMETMRATGDDYDSPVSKHLITLMSERQLISLLLLTILSLVGLERFIARREKSFLGT